MLDLWQGFGDLLSCVKVSVVLASFTEGFSFVGQCCFDLVVRIEKVHVCSPVISALRMTEMVDIGGI